MSKPPNPPNPPASALQDTGLHEKICAFDQTDRSRSYPIDKLEAHINNIPHMAISIFVFDGDKLLLQQRASTKYHSAGLWANTVCSHPRWKETHAECAVRRLQEELGWKIPLREFGQIDYAAQVGELYENEQVHCFYGQFDARIDVTDFNPGEVSDVEWLTIPEIEDRISQRPELFTEWFKIYMHSHKPMIASLIENQPEITAEPQN